MRVFEHFSLGLGQKFYINQRGGQLVSAWMSIVFVKRLCMRFDLLEYETTVGHLSLYYDAGGMFDAEVMPAATLPGIEPTTTISRKFGSGWEAGGYATLTDVPSISLVRVHLIRLFT